MDVLCCCFVSMEISHLKMHGMLQKKLEAAASVLNWITICKALVKNMTDCTDKELYVMAMFLRVPINSKELWDMKSISGGAIHF